MAWNFNQYYKLSQAGTTAISMGESLLQSYPLTRSCLTVLGHRLVESVEFGYFKAGYDIIVEGEQGKDLFLLCTGTVDVLVGGKMVVNMAGPSLLGDKGIVESSSTRAATIRVGEKQTCLFLKIPMDLFLKDFKAKVADALFAQESAIYAAMFQTIQDRLFTYMTHQKNLWEEAHTTLNQLNMRLISKGIENQKPANWDPNTWAQVKTFLLKLIGFKWSPELEASTPNLYKVLAKYLGVKTAPLKSRLKPDEYNLARARLWQGWIDEVAKVVAKHLPKTSLPIDIGEVELFNPKLFRVKLLTLLRSFEKKFPSSEQGQHKAEQFFGKAETINFLELSPYLDSFDQNFKVPRTQWVKALLAQKTAQIAAKSENDFNGSIVRMQGFVDRVKGMALDLGTQEVVKEVDFAVIDHKTTEMLPSYDAFLRTSEVPVGGHLGEIIYHPDEVPKIDELIKISGSKTIRTQIEQSFHFIASTLHLSMPGLQSHLWQSFFRIYRTSASDTLPSRELGQNYWIPISNGFRLFKGTQELSKLTPGTLLGGNGWGKTPGDDQSLQVLAPEKSGSPAKPMVYCLLCLPKAGLPWNQPKWDPQQIVGKYAHLLQWVVDHLNRSIVGLVKERGESFGTWSKAELFRDLEQRVRQFENKGVQVSGKFREAIFRHLNETLGMKTDDIETNNSVTLSKQVYNFLLRRIKTNNPSMNIDEVGNQAYTQFRLNLTQMVEIYKLYDPNHKPMPQETDVFLSIENQLRRLFLKLNCSVNEGYFNFSDPLKPKVFVGKVAEDLSTSPDLFKKFTLNFIELLENVQLNLIIEAAGYQQKLGKVHSIRSQYDLAAMQNKLVSEGVQRLQSFLKAGINQTV